MKRVLFLNLPKGVLHNGPAPNSHPFNSLSADRMQTMKIFRTILATQDKGDFLVDALHESGKVQSLTVHPISDDSIIGNPLEYGTADLPDVIKQIESCLTEI